MTEKKTPVKAQEKAVVKWKGEQITVSFRDVKTLICPYATDQEAAVFLKTCQSLQLNPFANEIYLIKYGEKDKAAMVIAIDSYLKSAESNANFNGHEAGIVLKDSGGKLEFREGSLILPDEVEKLVGGYARVYRTDREKSFYMAVNKAECLRYTKDGNLTKFWAKEKQPSMLRLQVLTTSGIYRIVNKYLRAADISPPKMGPHRIRHGFGKNYILNGGDTRSLQEIMGHENISVTEEYVELSREEVQDKHHRFTPLRSAHAAAQCSMFTDDATRQALDEVEEILAENS